MRVKSKRERMSNFTITTNKQTAEGIENQSDWNKKMGHEISWVLGEISHMMVGQVSRLRLKMGIKSNQRSYFFRA